MSLPSGWNRYTTDDGKEYFHNATSNVTQWEAPAVAEASVAEVYQYKPSSDHELQGLSFGLGDSCGGAIPSGEMKNMIETETVSLTTAPSGQISSSVSSFGGVGGGGATSGAGGSTSAAGGAFGSIGGVISAATSDDGAGMSGIMATLLNSAQQLFDVSTDDVVARLKASMMPFKADPNAANEFRSRPDFWGPFWVATTAVLFLAATGNFATLLATADDHTKFKADYSLVSLAATMVYGCLIGVPVVTRGALWMSGQEANSINFHQMICVYGYSITPAIPVSILCIVNQSLVRTFACIAGLSIGLLFIKAHLWADISVEQPSLKWTMTGLLAGSQVIIFLVYRVHFFV